jgi:hypothetical protein
MEQFLTEHKIWLEIVATAGAMVFGLWQIFINRRLRKLQDYVAIAVVPDSRTGKINLLNVGRTNLYLCGFDMPDNNMKRFEKPRLIPAGTGDSAYYWIDLPKIHESVIARHYEFGLKLYLEDEFDQKWVSEHGLSADRVLVEKDGKQIDALGFRV